MSVLLRRGWNVLFVNYKLVYFNDRFSLFCFLFLSKQLRQLKKLQATQKSLHHKLGISKEGEDEQEGNLFEM